MLIQNWLYGVKDWGGGREDRRRSNAVIPNTEEEGSESIQLMGAVHNQLRLSSVYTSETITKHISQIETGL